MYEAITLTIGIVGFCFLLAYIALNIDAREHGILSLLLLLFAVAVSLLIPAVAVNNNDYCSIEINESALNTTTNITSNTYGRYCFTNNSTTSTTFFKVVYGLPTLIFIYIFVYLAYKVLISRRKP